MALLNGNGNGMRDMVEGTMAKAFARLIFPGLLTAALAWLGFYIHENDRKSDQHTHQLDAGRKMAGDPATAPQRFSMVGATGIEPVTPPV
jgi:hypothetical protein